MRAYADPLAAPSIASAVAPPPLLHTITDLHTCRTQCGARCDVRGALQKGGGRQTGVNRMQARALRSEHHAPRPSCARLRHQNANTDKPTTKSRAWGAREAQRGTWVCRALSPQVHRSPSCDHLPDAREQRCPAITALCFDDVRSHLFGWRRNSRITQNHFVYTSLVRRHRGA